MGRAFIEGPSVCVFMRLWSMAEGQRITADNNLYLFRGLKSLLTRACRFPNGVRTDRRFVLNANHTGC